MIDEYKFKIEGKIIKGFITLKDDLRSNNFLIYNSEEVLKKGFGCVRFGFDFEINNPTRKQLIKLLDRFINVHKEKIKNEI